MQGPNKPSTTLAQHWTNNGSMCPVCCGGGGGGFIIYTGQPSEFYVCMDVERSDVGDERLFKDQHPPLTNKLPTMTDRRRALPNRVTLGSKKTWPQCQISWRHPVSRVCMTSRWQTSTRCRLCDGKRRKWCLLGSVPVAITRRWLAGQRRRRWHNI